MEQNSKTAEKILAIETSSRIFSIALAENLGKIFLKGTLFLNIGLRHSEILKEACDSLLSQCNWKKEDLTAVAVCTGPGSFTGLRVGVSFARAICQGLNLPLIGIPAFEVMHAGVNAVFQGLKKNGVHCILIDSVKNELFGGFFEFGKKQALEPYRIYSLLELFKKLRAFSKIWISGDGFLHYQKNFETKLGKRLLTAGEEFHFPHARHLAVLALEKLKVSNRKQFVWEKVVPFYLRPSMAEERIHHLGEPNKNRAEPNKN